MKSNRKSESGRSMTETIAVLVIIGLLAVASLGGYSFVVKRWRERQSVDQINAIVVGMRAGNLSKRYEKGAIPVQTIVRGLKMNDNDNAAAVLPDSADSWAKVTSLGINSYMIQLEVLPGTCEELLAGTVGADLIGVSVPDGGCKAENGDCTVLSQIGNRSLAEWDIASEPKKLTEAEQDDRLEKIREVCAAQPQLSLIWGCSEGVNNYFYGGQCHRCDKDETEDKNGRCCKTASLIEVEEDGKKVKVCGCASGVYDPHTHRCVGCLENKDCWDSDGVAEYSTKVCDTSKHKCVECMNDGHCFDPNDGSADFPNLRNENWGTWTKHICALKKQKCVECDKDNPCTGPYIIDGWNQKGYCIVDKYTCTICLNNYKGGTTTAECPADHPLCINPGMSPGEGDTGSHCDDCPPNTTWSVARQQCVCPDGKILLPDGTCGSCVPWHSDTHANNGCSPAGQATDTCISSDTPGAGANAGKCHECATDYKSNERNSNDVDAMYIGKSRADMCDSTNKYCSNHEHKPGQETFTCHKCFHTRGTNDKFDIGCELANPVCDEDGNNGKGVCGCRTNTDCAENYQCDIPNGKHFGTCVRCPEHSSRPLNKEYCDCEDGYHKVCGSVVADVTGARCGSDTDATWTCKPGCFAPSDCEANYDCVGGSLNPKTVGECLPCPPETPVRPPEGTVCLACLDCEIFDQSQGKCVQDCATEKFCLSKRGCTASLSGQQCIVQENNAGACYKMPDLIQLPGAISGSKMFYIPPTTTGDDGTPIWKMTWPDADRFCRAYGKVLASIQDACMKDIHADSGYDCPNITDIRGKDEWEDQGYRSWTWNGTTYSLGDWAPRNSGTFWVNGRLPGTCKSLRVTSSCGNNHATEICNHHFPLCTDG